MIITWRDVIERIAHYIYLLSSINRYAFAVQHINIIIYYRGERSCLINLHPCVGEIQRNVVPVFSKLRICKSDRLRAVSWRKILLPLA